MERKLRVLPDYPWDSCYSVFSFQCGGLRTIICHFALCLFSIWLGFIQNHDPCLLRFRIWPLYSLISSNFSCISLSVHVVIYVGDDQVHRLHLKYTLHVFLVILQIHNHFSSQNIGFHVKDSLIQSLKHLYIYIYIGIISKMWFI